MAELARYIEAFCAEQRSCETRKRQSMTVQEAFKHVTIVHDTTLLPEIMKIGISSFAAHQLAKEFRKAELFRFCADEEL